MRYVEVRRHAMRGRQGQDLSQDGVNLARHVGAHIGPFNLIITSTYPRAIQTAIAMGFAVHEKFEELNTVGETIMWDASFKTLARMIEQSEALMRLGQVQRKLWSSAARAIPDGGSTLVITHSGVIEIGAVSCIPWEDHEAWGEACDYCEGVRLTYDEDEFVAVEILRLKQDRS
jgi:broad specificity phosphatase PhoE